MGTLQRRRAGARLHATQDAAELGLGSEQKLAVLIVRTEVGGQFDHRLSDDRLPVPGDMAENDVEVSFADGGRWQGAIEPIVEGGDDQAGAVLADLSNFVTKFSLSR